MTKLDWEEAIVLAEQMFGPKCCSLTTNDAVLIVKHKGSTLFILQKKEENDFITMHLRAGLMPNAAAWIASSFFVNMDFVLGENFEFSTDKTMVYGKEALKFAADHIHELWDLEGIKDDVDPKYEGTLNKANRPKGSLYN